MGSLLIRLFAFTLLPLKVAMLKAAFYGVMAMALLFGTLPVRAQSCLEQIVSVQQQLKHLVPRPKQPAEQQQSVAAQDAQQPTPGSLAAAGVTQPESGPLGALNQAMNRQAAGDEAGCLKALAEARRLAGLN